MNSVSILLKEPAWPELATRQADLIYLQNSHLQLALVRGGTRSGKDTVIMRIDLPQGRVLLFETTLAIWGTALDTIRAAGHPE